jgi:hypothetical protein
MPRPFRNDIFYFYPLSSDKENCEASLILTPKTRSRFTFANPNFLYLIFIVGNFDEQP